MARQKKVNPAMSHIKEMIENRTQAREDIKARLARQADAEIALHTKSLYEAIFEEFPDAGDSEISNSVGVSRNTIYLWRRDYVENYRGRVLHGASIEEVKAIIPPKVAPIYDVEKVSWEGRDRLVFDVKGSHLHVITYDSFGYGDTPEEADIDEMMMRRTPTPNERPDWLTDEVLKAEAERFDVNIPFAPWN